MFMRDIVTSIKFATGNLFNGIPVVEASALWLRDKLSDIKKADILAYDTETSTLDPYSDDAFIIGVSLCWSDYDACFIPFEHDDLSISGNEMRDRIAIVKEILEDPTIQKVAQNGKYDRQMLSQVC